MSGIYVSTGAFRGGRLIEMAKACEELGVGLELSSGVRWHAGLQAEIEEVVQWKGKVLVHNYFPPPENPFVLNLAALTVDTWTRSMIHVREAIDLSVRCGAPFYSVHSGFALNLNVEDLGKPEAQASKKKVPYAMAYQAFLKAVQNLSAYAKTRGVRLLLENNVITREQVKGESPLLMTEPAELAHFFRDLNDDNVGLLMDVGHAKVAAAALGFEPGKFFEELAGWIGAVHLSDNDGVRDNNQSFGEDAWFGKYFLGNLPLVIEVYGIGIDGAAELVDVVKRWMGEKKSRKSKIENRK
jgi:sugar phosphate isomerase/epimerase